MFIIFLMYKISIFKVFIISFYDLLAFLRQSMNAISKKEALIKFLISLIFEKYFPEKCAAVS